ncbi:MAG TPA: patatin-like phospholipase family protein [Chloroflexia bacterium]|nr:patatin-like phospholipase family protein [Chloroflexia bacterium]
MQEQESEAQILTALVLQGAGALGAYECGVIKELYRSRKKGDQEFRPDVITGISSGAINAAILASSGIETLEKVWLEDFALLENGHGTPAWTFPESLARYTPPVVRESYESMVRMFEPVTATLEPFYRNVLPPIAQQYLGYIGNESMYRLRHEYFFLPPFAALMTTSIYDTAPLKETLVKKLGQEEHLGALNKNCSVVVTAANAETGEPAYFGNTVCLQDAEKCNEAKEFANLTELTVEHILASGSLPPSFPATQIEGNYYYDGGLFLNTPLRVAIDCLKRIKRVRNLPEAKLEVIVVEAFPMRGNLPSNVEDTLYRASDIMFSSKIELDDKLFRRFNSVVDLTGDIEHLGKLATSLANKYDKLNEQLKQELQAAGFEEKIHKLRDGFKEVEEHPELKELEQYQKIDYFTRVPFCVAHNLKNPSDFTRETLKKRIDAGAEEAHRQGIDRPKKVDTETVKAAKKADQK